MKVKEVTAEEFALATGKFLGAAEHSPVVIRSPEGAKLVLQAVEEDDLIDTLVTSHPRFRASIRRGRREFAAGKGIPLDKARKALGL